MSKIILQCKMDSTFLVYLHLLTCLVLLCTSQSTAQSSTMTVGSTMYSNATLVSPGAVFELGFTSSGARPNNSSPVVYTLAIWYAKAPDKKVVWVADRNMAMQSNNASFSLSPLGDLQVNDYGSQSPKLIWTSDTTNLNVMNATIEDSGNLVLRDTNNNVVWQSFDDPTDTLLPGQNFTPSRGNGLGVFAWEDDGDWSRGNYSLRWKSGAVTASWQIPYPWDMPISDYWSVTGFSQVYLTLDGDFRGDNITSGIPTSIGNSSHGVLQDRLVRLTLDKDGNLRMYSWLASNTNWDVEWQAMGNSVDKECEIPGYCGSYSICNQGMCTCPPQFEFVNGRDKRLGCRRTQSAALARQCNANAPALNDTFVPVSNANWPFNDLPAAHNVTLADCQQQCLQKCECQAVISRIPANDTDLLETCWLKKDALLNGRVEMINIITYLRAGAESHAQSPLQSVHKDDNTLTIIWASTFLGVNLILVALSGLLGYRLFVARKERRSSRQMVLQEALGDKWVAARGALIRFTYEEIELMTSNFKLKIGAGGYGTVFKGQIGSCELQARNSVTTVAVKRLDGELSYHVEREFQTEVKAVGRIHHLHLVSLYGYCTDAHHRLLVYEYVENGALNRNLFQGTRLRLGHPMLEWRTRFAIATQIARGLAYLHEDCSLQMIHCDVKPANILLDASYCAKIADFGLLRTRTRDITTHMRSHTTEIYGGTYGYIAPEIKLNDGSPITNKVDVFSYGMVLLEIISGRRNLNAPYFPRWAYPRLETDAFMHVVDPAMVNVDPDEVKRALRVAFWCINERADARQSMRAVERMLQGHVAVDLPVPRPAYLGVEDGDHASTTRRFGSSALHPTTSANSTREVPTPAPSRRSEQSVDELASSSYCPIGQSQELMQV